MRILKFAGVFLAVLILIFLVVFGFNLKGLVKLFENQKDLKEGKQWVAKTQTLNGLTEYIGRQPGHVAIASLALHHPDSSLIYNEHSPRTMGRLSTLLVLIEYAREVEQGKINPRQPIPLKEVSAYQLPYMYHSNHEGALSQLQNEGKISDRKTVALDDIMQIAVTFNDVAAADFILSKVGRQKTAQLMDRLSLDETESPLPLCGLYITLNPHLHHKPTKAYLDSLSGLSRARFDQLVIQNTRRFIREKSYHKKVIKQFNRQQGWGIKFTRQRDALAFFPKTTAADMAGIIKKLQQNTLISSPVSRRVKQFLSWPMNHHRMDNYFRSYGALYDNRMGMLNGVNFGVPTDGGQPFAQAVFFDRLPIALWFRMSNKLMQQDFMQRIIWDKKLRSKTRRAIQQYNSSSAVSQYE